MGPAPARSELDDDMILILSNPMDRHASHVADALRERGVAVMCFDPARFPTEAELSISWSAGGRYEPRLHVDGQTIDLSRLQAIWYRRPEKPIPHAELVDPTARAYAAAECRLVIHDLWSSLGCPWLPAAPHVVQLAERKLTQLRIAGELGFELPPTLITNRPADVLELYRQHDGGIVSKQAAQAFTPAVGSSMIRFTELVTTRDLAHLHAIAYCPMTFQAYVAKRVELRITVVGRRVFAAEIHSQATNRTRYDWRRYDHGHTPYLPHMLPPEVEARCARLVERLGLRYGAIDMVVTPDDRYVFLEINPNGQYLWIESAAGLPITDAICDLLVGDPPASATAGSTTTREIAI
jgi:glutathione synthase/RimK-type ligase-like ATP-grasp enzyme